MLRKHIYIVEAVSKNCPRAKYLSRVFFQFPPRFFSQCVIAVWEFSR